MPEAWLEYVLRTDFLVFLSNMYQKFQNECNSSTHSSEHQQKTLKFMELQRTSRTMARSFVLNFRFFLFGGVKTFLLKSSILKPRRNSSLCAHWTWGTLENVQRSPVLYTSTCTSTSRWENCVSVCVHQINSARRCRIV